MKNIFCIFAISALLCGCAGIHGGITSTQDRFSNKTINQTTRNNLSMGLADSGTMMLDARQEIDGSSGSTRYCLMLSSFNLGYAALIPTPFNDSLYVIADDKRFSFSTASHQGLTFFYPTTKEQLLAICCATNVEVRVIQLNGTSFEKRFNSNNRSVFHTFAEKFLK